jgi:hypothetical protein
MPAYMYPSDNAVRVKSDGITVGNMSTGFIVGISPTSFNMQSSSSSTRLALTSNEIAMYKSGTQSVSINSDGSFLLRSVTGGTGSQKIVIDPTGLGLYNSSGTKTVSFDSETGDATIYGSISNGIYGARVEIDKTDKNRITMYSDAMFRNSYTTSIARLYSSVTGATLSVENSFLFNSSGYAYVETDQGTQKFSYTSKTSSPDRLVGCFLVNTISGGATASTGADITNDTSATIDIIDDSFFTGQLSIKSGAPNAYAPQAQILLLPGGTGGGTSVTKITGANSQLNVEGEFVVGGAYARAVGGVGTTTSGSALVVSHGITTYTPASVVTSVNSNSYSATRHNHVYSSLTGSNNFVVYGTTTSATGLTSTAAIAFNWMVV